MGLMARVCLDPLIAVYGGGRGISKGEEVLSVLVCVGVGWGCGTLEAGDAMRDYVLFVGWEQVSGFRSVSLFPAHK